jgi:hypothetical protein
MITGRALAVASAVGRVYSQFDANAETTEGSPTDPQAGDIPKCRLGKTDAERSIGRSACGLRFHEGGYPRLTVRGSQGRPPEQPTSTRMALCAMVGSAGVDEHSR